MYATRNELAAMILAVLLNRGLSSEPVSPLIVSASFHAPSTAVTSEAWESRQLDAIVLDCIFYSTDPVGYIINTT